MRKLIVITLMLAAVVGLGIAETVWAADHYGDMCDELRTAYRILGETEEGEVSLEAADILASVAESRDDLVTGIAGNENLTERPSEFAAQALVYALEGQNTDARASVASALQAAERLRRGSVPRLGNIL